MSRVLSALLVGGILLNVFALYAGASPLYVYEQLLQTTFTSAYGWSQVLFKTTPLVFLGVAAAIAFRAGVLNIGLEGQLIMGSLAMGAVGVWLPAGTPHLLAIGCLLLAGALAGAFWAYVPALLKVRFGAPEVVTTLMLNFIAALSSGFAMRWLAVEESTHTKEMTFRLSRIDAWLPAARGSQLSTAFLIAIAAVIAARWLLFRSRAGFRLRAVGENPRASSVYGIDPKKQVVLAFVTSGALAGLCAATYVLGAKGFHEDGFSGGVGFLGLGVALLAHSAPFAVLPAAFLFGTLSHGSLAINTLVPKEMTDVLVAAIMISVLFAQARKRV